MCLCFQGEYGWPIVGGGGNSGGPSEYAMGDPRERQPREFPAGGLDQDRPNLAAKEADFQLDAAQRKKLPAWIREGLEKMEREKLRKVSIVSLKSSFIVSIYIIAFIVISMRIIIIGSILLPTLK